MTILHTARLRLEPLDDVHFDGLYQLNSDPVVMRYITGAADTPEKTREMIALVKPRWERFGFSWWAFIERATGELIGAGCVQHLGRDPANPLELGWRLRQDKWRQGYASEAAQAMATFAFDTLGAERLCAVCHPDNAASATVMQRLGMHYTGQGEWYGQTMATYAIERAAWAARVPG